MVANRDLKHNAGLVQGPVRLPPDLRGPVGNRAVVGDVANVNDDAVGPRRVGGNHLTGNVHLVSSTRARVPDNGEGDAVLGNRPCFGLEHGIGS